jgi:hypothetical protein
MRRGATSHASRNVGQDRGTAAESLDRRIRELEQLTSSQSRELPVQFERIAQLLAEWDILRIRFMKSENTVRT